MTSPSLSKLEQMFLEWWAQSYPTPPGVHARNTHVGFGAWLVEQLQTKKSDAKG